MLYTYIVVMTLMGVYKYGNLPATCMTIYVYHTLATWWCRLSTIYSIREGVAVRRLKLLSNVSVYIGKAYSLDKNVCIKHYMLL